MSKSQELVAESDWTEEGFGEWEHEGWGFGKRPRFWKYTQNDDVRTRLGKDFAENGDVEELERSTWSLFQHAGQTAATALFASYYLAGEAFNHIARDMEALAKAAKGCTVTMSAGTLYIVFDGKTAPDWVPALKRVVSHDPQVTEYVRKYELGQVVDLLKMLAEAILPEKSQIVFTVEADGETDGEWLIANLRIKEDADKAYDLFDQFTEAWIGKTTPATRKRVSLTYSAW